MSLKKSICIFLFFISSLAFSCKRPTQKARRSEAGLSRFSRANCPAYRPFGFQRVGTMPSARPLLHELVVEMGTGSFCWQDVSRPTRESRKRTPRKLLFRHILKGAFMRYGYARVSTIDQDTALQDSALALANCAEVVREKRSAVKKRPELEALLKRLGPGDELVVYKLDRLARSLRDLIRIAEHVQDVGATLKSLTVHCRIGSSEKHDPREAGPWVVHCRIGSSETFHARRAPRHGVHCRIGSSEKSRSGPLLGHRVHCRIGSSESCGQ